MKNGISVIIPSYKSEAHVNNLINALINQSKKPDEVIFVDSTHSKFIDQIIDEYSKIININLVKVKNAYPGEARNIGIKQAQFSHIAFLDTKTIPTKNWLKTYYDLSLKDGFDIVFGATKYNPLSFFQEILCMCIFGKVVETTPGTLLKKNVLTKVGFFTERVRASDDLEWRNKAKQEHNKTITPEENYLTYNSISKNLYQESKRQFIYQIHSARTDVQNNNKMLVFGMIMIFLTILIPKWNSFVGWENSFYYIPNITKVYFFNLSLLAIILLGTSKLRLFKKFFYKIFILCFGILSFYIAYSWNNVAANWIENSVFYLPHITKLYVITILSFGFIYRSVYCPLKGGFQVSDLLPIKFFMAGFCGLILDIVKIPGYFIGGVVSIYRAVKKVFYN